MSEAPVSQRLDKWLWIARFFRTRSLSASVCEKGRVRVNRMVVEKAHYAVRPGDVLTFPQADRIRVVRVTGIGPRRGSASDARLLYEDLDAAPEPAAGGAPDDG